MPFTNAKQANNAQVQLQAGISASATSVILQSGQGSLLPTAFPFWVKIEQYDTAINNYRVLKRELVLVTNRSADTLTVTRSAGNCPASYNATTQTNTAFSFNAGDTLTQTLTAEDINDIKDTLATALQTSGWTLTGTIKGGLATAIASAATTDLNTVTTWNQIHIAGTATITSFGTVTSGTSFECIFDGIATLTHNATSLVLPGATNITTAVGDTMTIMSEWGGNWRVVRYQKANGQALTATVSAITGEIRIWSTKIVPTGWLISDWSAVSRATYATLFSTIVPTIGTFTVTIASPWVFTLNSHGLILDDAIYLTTTGALPTGLAQNTIYYVISAGLTTNTFQLSLTRWGVAINTSGTQSGTHTLISCPFGLGNGSTTFNLPNFKGSVAVGFNSADTEFRSIGKTWGEKAHVLTVAEMPSHTHTYNNFAGGNVSYSSAWGLASSAASSPTGSAGTDGAHNNIQPYLTVNYIIKT